MAASKKPRKLKDLKARLGRNAPASSGSDSAIPPPAIGGAKAPGSAIPPPAIGSPSVPPPGANPSSPPGIIAPPFAQKSQPPVAVDPFAAAAHAAAGPQEVRLVFDDKPVDDSEVGRKRKGRTLLLLAMGALLGILLGFFSGSVIGNRRIHNLAVRDGKDLHSAVTESSNVVTEVQRLVNEAVRQARGGQGTPPAVDYASVEALRALEKPFSANVFSRKNYSLFEPSTVDSLFDYYNHINQAWTRIETLSAMTTGEQRREELNASAASMENATALVGCVVGIADSRYQCSLGFVRVPDDSEGKVKIRASQRARREADKDIYVGEGELGAGNFVLLVNNQQSMGVLGTQSSLFAEYVREVSQLKALIDETTEIQGRIQTSLGQVASNKELFTF